MYTVQNTAPEMTSWMKQTSSALLMSRSVASIQPNGLSYHKVIIIF